MSGQEPGLRERIAEAIHAGGPIYGSVDEITEVVLAFVQAELAAKDPEAELVTLTGRVADHRAALKNATEARMQAEAERDRLRAAVERVRRLAVRWHHGLATDEVHARELDAALDQAPAEEASPR